MGLGCDEVLLSDAAEASLDRLKKAKDPEAASVMRRVAAVRSRLKADCQAGTVIPYPLARPAKPLETRHAPITNLYKVELPGFWRLLYTITRVDKKRYVYILEIVSHPDYDKWFPGSKGP